MPRTACFTEVCSMYGIPEELASPTQRTFCANLISAIVGGGGGSLLKAYPCPMIAMFQLAPSETDTTAQETTKAQLASNLGISGFYEGEID